MTTHQCLARADPGPQAAIDIPTGIAGLATVPRGAAARTGGRHFAACGIHHRLGVRVYDAEIAPAPTRGRGPAIRMRVADFLEAVTS